MIDIADYTYDENLDYLGGGGFADVYRATYTPTGERRALKIARKGEESLARIRREIKVQRKLHHANVMEILDYDQTDFRWFATVVAEGSLSKIGDVPLPEAEVLRLAEEILGALGVAHRREDIHRDISPGNILRSGGRWLLADWGFVATPDSVDRLTRTGTAGGTYEWAAPEVLVDAHRATAPSDLYALGKVLCWLLTREAPRLKQDPQLPIQPHWAEFLGKLATEDLKDRYGSAEEALQALAKVVPHVPSAPERFRFPHQPASNAPSSIAARVKAMLPRPEDRIKLKDLISAETSALLESVTAPRFDVSRPETSEDSYKRILDYYAHSEPMMHVIFNGFFYGHSDLIDFTKSVLRLVPKQDIGGYTRLIRLRDTPAFLCFCAGAFGAVLSEDYQRLISLFFAPYWSPDDGSKEPLPARLNADSVFDRDLLRQTTSFNSRKLPASDLLVDLLRPLVRVQMTDSEYETAFDRFEVMMSLFLIDGGHVGFTSGRFAWRGPYGPAALLRGPIAEVHDDFMTQRELWGPLRSGFFDSKVDRAEAAFAKLVEYATRVATSL